MRLHESAATAKAAAIYCAALASEQKNQALQAIARALQQQQSEIIAANQADLAEAKQNRLSAPLLKRLKFDAAKIDDVCHGIASLIQLPDPIGQTLDAKELDQGLELYRVSCPIGAIGVIFESRPDALVQISTLCLKSGNAVLLKGGSEAARTNKILADIIAEATTKTGLPQGWIQLMQTREDVAEMLKLDDCIDLIIPRGSNAFVKYIMDHTHIPVLGHADGICHVYIDSDADIDMAVRIAADSKCQYVAVCNAAETLLVDQAIATKVLPGIQTALAGLKTEIRGCDRTRAILPDIQAATDEDWDTEYLDTILSIKIVDGLTEAIDFINTHGSGHTDAIVTSDKTKAATFMNLVDAANVFWNCSTRFSDGFRYGLGAEVGISTNKIHARGPVGLEGLMIYKWKLVGHGQIVADYTGPQARTFTHQRLDQSFTL